MYYSPTLIIDYSPTLIDINEDINNMLGNLFNMLLINNNSEYLKINEFIGLLRIYVESKNISLYRDTYHKYNKEIFFNEISTLYISSLENVINK
jgi:hypothetical protein